MNFQEAVALTRYVRALCPHQKMDEYTADAWGDVLAGYDFETCKQAAAILGQKQPFIAPAEIITEVRKGRRERLANFQYEPSDGDEDPREYLRRLRAQIADVADGHRPAELMPANHRGELIGKVLAEALDIADPEDPAWN